MGVFEELRWQVALAGAPPMRPLRVYPAHAFRKDCHLQDLIDLLEPTWRVGQHYRIMAPQRHTAVDTGGDNSALAVFLIQRMSASEVMWAFAGRYATERAWLNFENAFAEAMPMPAIAIIPRGQSNTSLVATANHTREEVGWQARSVISATLKALPLPVLEELYPTGRVLACSRPLTSPQKFQQALNEVGGRRYVRFPSG